MSPAFAVNPPPDARCDCGPNLICTHGALLPIDIREIQIADKSPTGPIPVVPATKQVADNHKEILKG